MKGIQIDKSLVIIHVYLLVHIFSFHGHDETWYFPFCRKRQRQQMSVVCLKVAAVPHRPDLSHSKYPPALRTARPPQPTIFVSKFVCTIPKETWHHHIYIIYIIYINIYIYNICTDLSTFTTQNAKRTFWNACSERRGIFSGFMDPRSVRILFLLPAKRIHSSKWSFSRSFQAVQEQNCRL